MEQPNLEADQNTLRVAIERLHNCTAKHRHFSVVNERFKGKIVWQGIVHTFDIAGHPSASEAYAWSEPIEGSDNRQVFAVLKQGQIQSPADAIRASILQRSRERSHG